MEPEDILAFLKAVLAHDLTHAFSDDPSSWRNGQDQLRRMKGLAQKIDRGIAVAIWNANVMQKISKGHEKPFLLDPSVKAFWEF